MSLSEKLVASIRDATLRDGKCAVWDLGPPRPVAPEPPVEPKKTGKAADDALAAVVYEDAIEDYKTALRSYAAMKREYDAWRASDGGPRKMYAWSIDVSEWCDRFPGRWVLNLPPNVKPGAAQLRAEAQAAEERIALQQLLDRDPQFGTKPAFQGAA